MNRIVRNIIGGALVLGLFALMTACSSDEDISYEKKTYSVDAENVNLLSLSDQDKKVEVQESNDDKIHITYFESDKESYDINVSDEGKLGMKLVINKGWKDYIGLKTDKKHHLVKIAVPNDISSNMKIETSNGDIVLTDLKINGAIEAATTRGKIKATNVKASKNVKMKTKNDDIILQDVDTNGSMEATINNGDMKVSNVNVGDTMKLKTKDGDITGTIIGSYDVFAINSKVSKGESNLPETKEGGEKLLDVDVNNGDINLKFVK